MDLKRPIVKILLVGIVAWPVVAGVAARSLIITVPLESADAIVVMSGSSAYLERTQKAAQLYHEGHAPMVLLTDDHRQGGWDNTRQRNPFFFERAMDELIKAGVPQEKIGVVPGFAESTRDESVIVGSYAQSKGFRSVLIITSAYHSRRALRCMRQVFANTGTNVGIETAGAAPSFFWWTGLEGWRTVGTECVKSIYYWFKYD